MTTTLTLSFLHHLWRCLALAVLCCLFGNSTVTFAQISNSEYPLFASSVVHCDEMITLHRWEGNCCSLNVTAGNGCILNVMDGYCNVRGQVWSLEFNSTYDKVSCPPSEYTNDMLGMKEDYSDTVVVSGGVRSADNSGFALAVVGTVVAALALALAGVMA